MARFVLGCLAGCGSSHIEPAKLTDYINENGTKNEAGATAERGNLLTGFSGTKSVKIAVGAYKLEGCDKVTVAAGDDLNDTNLVWIDYPA